MMTQVPASSGRSLLVISHRGWSPARKVIYLVFRSRLDISVRMGQLNLPFSLLMIILMSPTGL